MGEVYRADDTRLKRPVALKRMAHPLRADQLYRQRFLEEAQRASGLTGTHVAAIYDVVEEQGEIFLVMEYVEGETLRQRLREPFTVQQFLDIAVQCVDALVVAHAHGIVHCDIKPENIMLTSDQQVKILDFGVAKRLPRSDQSTTLEKVGVLGGTPAYMSPEVLLEKLPDGRADIFSLGVVFYETLAGHHPFKASSFVATSERILRETPPPIHIFNRHVPPELDGIVGHMLGQGPGRADRGRVAVISRTACPAAANLLPRPAKCSVECPASAIRDTSGYDFHSASSGRVAGRGLQETATHTLARSKCHS